VKKILSILIALGLVLSIFTIAAPTAGAACNATVTASAPPFCAGAKDTYNIAIAKSPVTLLAGNDMLSVEFGAGTTFDTFSAGDIKVNGNNVDVTKVVITDSKLVFPTPVQINAGAAITIVIAEVINPAPGQYSLQLDYQLSCCDPVVFDCGDYTVVPAISEYDFYFDFSPTYTGLVPGYVPPFKACGQNMSTTVHNTSIGGFLEPFDVVLDTVSAGCAAPCVNATMWFVLEACPPGEVVTLNWSDTGTWYTLVADNISAKYYVNNVTLPVSGKINFPAQIHFSSPGEYSLCFYAECPAVPCGAGSAIIAEECLEATVYQWKDAFKIELKPKWNLISVPLYPFDTTIESIFASVGALDQLMSVWYFGQCEDPDPDEGVWHTEVYNSTAKTFTGDVDNIVAGKSYWVRMCHPGDAGYNATLFPVSLWVWGNHAPMPPANPMGYFDVCEGWNMVGFKAPWTGTPLAATAEMDNLYLWNFNGAGQVEYGLIYDYDEDIQDWTYHLPAGCNMTPGVGYWIPFDGDSEIYPKP
jgi:hypothetical protein